MFIIYRKNKPHNTWNLFCIIKQIWDLEQWKKKGLHLILKSIVTPYTRSSSSDFTQILNIYNLEISYENPSFIDFCKMNNISTCRSNGMGGGGDGRAWGLFFGNLHTWILCVNFSVDPLLPANKLSLGPPPPPRPPQNSYSNSIPINGYYM